MFNSKITAKHLQKLSTGRRVHWGIQEISSAISLYSAGPRAYRWLLKKKYPLPGISTLRRWAGNIDVQPGMLTTVLQLMKDSSLSDFQRVCVISADEIKIQKSYEYDKKHDATLGPSNYMQVIMERGIFDNWKQPIYYCSDSKLTKQLILDVVKALEDINFHVHAMVTDLGGGNRGFWNEIGIKENHSWIENPSTHKPIHVFGDVPHLIKLLRNHFLDSGFVINDTVITADPLFELYNLTSGSDLNIAHSLKSEHLAAKNSERQKVKLATQLFSPTNSKALERLVELGLSHSTETLASSRLIKLVNDWFDLFNTKVKEEDSRDRMKAYGLALDTQNKILDDMTALMSAMRVREHAALLRFQKGIIITNNSLKNLFHQLRQDYGNTYILTYHLNEDTLEGFFSIMRATGGLHDHPKALEFTSRLRKYLLGRNESIMLSAAANVEEDKENSTSLQLDVDRLKNDSKVMSSTIGDTITSRFMSTLLRQTDCEQNDSELEDITMEEEVDDLTDLQYNGLENLAGFVAFKMRHKCKEAPLGFPTAHCLNDTSNPGWVNLLSEGGLYKPTPTFMKQVEVMNDIFQKLNHDTLLISANYLRQHLKRAETISLMEDAKRLFFRCKMYFRIRYLNAKIKETSKMRKRKFVKVCT